MEVTRSPRRIALVLPLRTILLVAAAIAVMWAFATIADAFLIVFVGIFLALVFEYPLRFVMAKTGLSRGLAATITVLGSAVAVTLLALLLLVPLVSSVRNFLHDLPQIVDQLRNSDELGFLGDTGAAGNVQEGANAASASVPDAISAVLGIAGDFFSLFLAGFTILFVCLFLLVDIGKLRAAAASVMMPGEDDRWLAVWDRITESVSRWAIGVVVVASIAGTTQGLTAWLLGSSYALALGVIAGLLDMIPNIGATMAGFILVPTLWAEEGVTAAIIMPVVILVYQQVENSIITPKVQGKAVQLSPFFIIVAVSLFGALLGVLGALTAVPLAATIQIFVRELTEARRAKVAEAKAATARRRPDRAQGRRLAPTPPRRRPLDAEDLLLLGLELLVREDALVLQLGQLLELGRVVRLGRSGRSGWSRRGLGRHLLVVRGLILRGVLRLLTVAHCAGGSGDDRRPGRHAHQPRSSSSNHQLSFPAFSSTQSRAACTTSCGSRSNASSSPPAFRNACAASRAHTFSHTRSAAEEFGSRLSAASAEVVLVEEPTNLDAQALEPLLDLGVELGQLERERARRSRPCPRTRCR